MKCGTFSWEFYELTTKQQLTVQQMQKCQTEWDILHIHQDLKHESGIFVKRKQKNVRPFKKINLFMQFIGGHLV